MMNRHADRGLARVMTWTGRGRHRTKSRVLNVLLFGAAAFGILLALRELPALRRYIRIERM